jgi:hypothetical protein
LLFAGNNNLCGEPVATTVSDPHPLPASDSVSSSCVPDHDYSDQPLPVEQLLVAANSKIEELEARLRSAEIERFGLERFSSNPQMIKFYTGFPTYKCLRNFFFLLFLSL